MFHSKDALVKIRSQKPFEIRLTLAINTTHDSPIIKLVQKSCENIEVIIEGRNSFISIKQEIITSHLQNSFMKPLEVIDLKMSEETVSKISASGKIHEIIAASGRAEHVEDHG